MPILHDCVIELPASACRQARNVNMNCRPRKLILVRADLMLGVFRIIGIRPELRQQKPLD